MSCASFSLSKWIFGFWIYFDLVILFASGILSEIRNFICIKMKNIVNRIRFGKYLPKTKDDSYDSGFSKFYRIRIFNRFSNFFGIILYSAPGNRITVKDDSVECQKLNMGSYNYLGFGEAGAITEDRVIKLIEEKGVGSSGLRNNFSLSEKQVELEDKMAKFMGTEAAIVFPMGFATNSLIIPCIMEDYSCLIISDTLNHSSIILGCRRSGAARKVFTHGDYDDLENTLHESIVNGQPVTGRPWSKILVIVEGIYSMEGTIVDLPRLIELKKIYKFYLWVDEAHSIGALGSGGRGVCEFFGTNPKNVDILMGTFTKSFSGVGGYIAGSADLINHIKTKSLATKYATTMSHAVAEQIIGALEVIDSREGDRAELLANNSIYFREKLQKKGFNIIGNKNSPVVPLLTTSLSGTYKAVMFMWKKGIASVMVGYPATPLLKPRIRFCLSSSHSKSDLDFIIDTLEKARAKILFT